MKHLSSGTHIVLRSQYGWEIRKINVYHDQVMYSASPNFSSFEQHLENRFACHEDFVMILQTHSRIKN